MKDLYIHIWPACILFNMAAVTYSQEIDDSLLDVTNVPDNEVMGEMAHGVILPPVFPWKNDNNSNNKKIVTQMKTGKT